MYSKTYAKIEENNGDSKLKVFLVTDIQKKEYSILPNQGLFVKHYFFNEYLCKNIRHISKIKF